MAGMDYLVRVPTQETRAVETDRLRNDLVSMAKDGGRYRIRTYDFHRVKMALYR